MKYDSYKQTTVWIYVNVKHSSVKSQFISEMKKQQFKVLFIPFLFNSIQSLQTSQSVVSNDLLTLILVQTFIQSLKVAQHHTTMSHHYLSSRDHTKENLSYLPLVFTDSSLQSFYYRFPPIFHLFFVSNFQIIIFSHFILAFALNFTWINKSLQFPFKKT